MPGTLAIALVASGLVNLGIATAYERGYGVLKRLGGSPLGRSGLVAAKLAVVALIAVAQVVGLVAVAALVLGWRPDAEASFLAMRSRRSSARPRSRGSVSRSPGRCDRRQRSSVANVLFLVAIAFGGAIVPIGDLPAPVADVVRFSPVGALADTYAAALGDGTPIAAPSGILLFWAVPGGRLRGTHLPLGLTDQRAIPATAARGRCGIEPFGPHGRHTLSSTTAVAVPKQGRPWTSEACRASEARRS